MVRVSRGGPAYTEQPFESYKVEVLVFGFAGGIAMAVSVRKITLWRVEVDNGPGLGYQIAKSIGETGINLSFVMAQTIGRRYSAVFGFESAADVSKATGLIKKAATAKAQQRKAA